MPNTPCYQHTTVRIASCGDRFAWELPPAPGRDSGYCSAPLPHEDEQPSAFATMIIVICGYDGSALFSRGERYDPSTNAWSPIASMGTARAAHAAAAIDGLLYAIGGS
eukprot:SAG31_NODE_35564_length_322_cov_0.439462_1_plen_107_part_11